MWWLLKSCLIEQPCLKNLVCIWYISQYGKHLLMRPLIRIIYSSFHTFFKQPTNVYLQFVCLFVVGVFFVHWTAFYWTSHCLQHFQIKDENFNNTLLTLSLKVPRYCEVLPYSVVSLCCLLKPQTSATLRGVRTTSPGKEMRQHKLFLSVFSDQYSCVALCLSPQYIEVITKQKPHNPFQKNWICYTDFP